jgi:hypothetical protein
MGYPQPGPLELGEIFRGKIEKSQADGIRKRQTNDHAGYLRESIAAYNDTTETEQKLYHDLAQVYNGTRPSGRGPGGRFLKGAASGISYRPHASTRHATRADHAYKEFQVQTTLDNSRKIRDIHQAVAGNPYNGLTQMTAPPFPLRF